MIGRLCGSISLSDIASQSKKYVYMTGTAVVLFLVVYLVTAIRIEDGVFSMVFMQPQQVVPFMVLIAINFIGFVL